MFAVCLVNILAILGGRDGRVGTHVPADVLNPTDCLMCEAITEPSMAQQAALVIERGLE